MKTVLVTGANGFVGLQSLRPLAERGYIVHAVDLAAPAEPHEAEWHRADLLDAQQTAGLIARLRPSHLLHFAWCAKPGTYWTSPENLRWVAASLHLLERFAASGGRRAVGAGTCAEYEWGGAGPFREHATPTRPGSLYGACKHALRVMASAYAAQVRMSFAWGRLFHLYGPREKPERLVASLVRSLLAGRRAVCRHGDYERDFLHVKDAGAAFAALLDSDVTGPVNVASGRAERVGRVAVLIAEQTGRPDLLEVRRDPPAEGDAPRVTADVSRLAGEVGWSPAFDLAAGIGETIAWWREHPDNATR